MTRPLIDKSIGDLEAIAERNRSHEGELALVLQELSHRSTHRARRLERQIAEWAMARKPQTKAEAMSSTAMTQNPARQANPAKASVSSRTLSQTADAVAVQRAKLIDLSRRSPLINFRHSNRSATMLRIVDERPDLLFDTICARGMRFEPLPDPEDTPLDEQTDEFQIAQTSARLTDRDYLAAMDRADEAEDEVLALQTAERSLRAKVRAQLDLPELKFGKAVDLVALAQANGFDTSYDLRSSTDTRETHHDDDRLRVLLPEKDLQKRLKSIWDRYRLHYRETGIHTLYLAIGFVEWMEDGREAKNHAPVLLLAVEIERRIVRSRHEYTLRLHEEGLQTNIALAEKMREHWNLAMPPLREDERPESYFIRLRAVLEQGRDLKLKQFVTLAVLPFPQMVLWKDLDPDRWPEDAFGSHRLLPAVMGVSAMNGDASPGEPYDIDDDEWATTAPALVRPADASQHSALIEADQGADLAIEGPPGTGKSETITNMIANAVASGKKVLFVAEKQAALQVVGNRLKASGLGPLALELHGENAKRSDVYANLKERLQAKAHSDPRHLALQRGRLQETRTLLRNYLAQLERPIGNLDVTAYDLVWREIRLREIVPQSVQADLGELIALTDAAEINRATMLAHRTHLDVFGEAVDAIDSEPRTLWLQANVLPVFGQQDQLRAAVEAANAAQKMAQHTEALLDTAALDLPDAAEDGDRAVDQLRALAPFGDLKENTVSAAIRKPDAARSLLHLGGRWRRLADRLRNDVENVDSCERAELGRLQGALDAMNDAPVAVADARAALAAVAELDDDAERNADLVGKLVALLSIMPEPGLDQVQILCGTLRTLSDQSVAIRALFTPGLLDPLSELAIAEQESAAEEVRDTRDQLMPDLDADGLEAEPEELKTLADTLENSGIFARLFGKDYKQAQRRAARLLRDTSDRIEAAELLRRTARLNHSVANFQNVSTVQALFPDILWKGVDSAFADLNEARAILVSAKAALAGCGLEQAIGAWLRLDTDGRARAGELAVALSPLIERLIAPGGDSETYRDAAARIGRRRANLVELDDALIAVGAKPDGMIVRDDEHLPARVEALDGCRAEFDRLREADGFDFVGRIADPLEPLARAMERIDALAGHDDAVSIMPALRASETPVALLDAVIDLGRDYCAAYADWRAASALLQDKSGLRAARLAAGDSASASASESWQRLTRDLQTLSRDDAGARQAARLFQYQSELSASGMERLGAKAVAGAIPASCLADAYELRLVSHLLNAFLSGDGSDLQKAGGLSLADARRRFAKIDEELHALEAQTILADRLNDTAPRGIGHGKRSEYTQSALLDNELGLKRPRTPLRDVIDRAGEALQTLKPVWMMSPTSAAQYIRPGSIAFDLLIVDEASQMRPEFALSAMLRADQFVVVGDANQLPPSDHFGVKADTDDQADAIGIDADAESILDVANQKFRRKRRLKWHYRSRHESLIKFSNREFYENDLIVFPSPSGEDDELLGTKLRYVPEMFPGTMYEASINQKEAEAVLAEALRLMIEYPQYSLGIAAMNAKQTALLEAEFEQLLLRHPAIARYVEEYTDSVNEFFIKNLENVQGDERDIILVSTVYGPDKDGVVKQNFGLMNREVGWRRLNVLVTRAKLSIRVFTSLRPNDVRVTPGSSKGIQAFHAYLTYLNEAPVVDEQTAGDAESDFEEVVAERLRAQGYQCIPQVGVNRFRIDIGVKHPSCDTGFLAGIECDGAPFHSGFTVRDRDRIRQQVLEGLNWRIYRIWSIDWYSDADREMQKLLGWLAEIGNERTTSKGDATDKDDAATDEQPTVSDPPEADIPVEASEAGEVGRESQEAPMEPKGKAMRPVDGIDWFEVERSKFYTIWLNGGCVGEVTVLSRGTQAPRMYGQQLSIPRPEYEGLCRHTGETRKHNDIYAAVRWVAKRASDRSSIDP